MANHMDLGSTVQNEASLKTILLVEDDQTIRDIVRIVLQSQEYTFLEAHSGLEGFRLAKQKRPDLIILDWMMPELEGIEVARILGRETATSNIPVIMLTTRDADADVEQSRKAGAIAHLVKPFSPLQLLRTVESVFASTENE